MLWGDDFMEEWLPCGAINPYSADLQEYNKAVAEAEKIYNRICNSADDYLKIAVRTGYSVEQILMIKHYIFYNIHQLTYSSKVVYHKFDPDLSMAHSWFRLSGADKPSSRLGTADSKGIEPHDYVLLKHELFEMRILIEGLCDCQAAAHKTAEQKYNYYDASKEFYGKLSGLQKQSLNAFSETTTKVMDIF